MQAFRLVFVMGLILAGPVAFAQSVDGMWEGEYWFMNRLERATFTFKVDGKRLTGQVTTYVGDRKLHDYEILDGSIENDQILFKTYSSTRKPAITEYVGTVSGNEITFRHWLQGFRHQAENLFPRSSQFTATRSPM